MNQFADSANRKPPNDPMARSPDCDGPQARFLCYSAAFDSAQDFACFLSHVTRHGSLLWVGRRRSRKRPLMIHARSNRTGCVTASFAQPTNLN